jgi:hypothetical protein
MNGTGNIRDISAEFVPMRKSLRKGRNRLGAETDRGRLLSNLDQQSPWRSDPDPRPWATHPMQSVQGMMKWQVELLAGGK